MAKYSAKANIKVRIPNENNLSGVSWLKRGTVLLEGDTIEELIEQAYAVPIPDDIDIAAIAVDSTLWLQFEGGSPTNRKTVTINTFREL